jgi:hypothetical protein
MVHRIVARTPGTNRLVAHSVARVTGTLFDIEGRTLTSGTFNLALEADPDSVAEPIEKENVRLAREAWNARNTAIKYKNTLDAIRRALR